MRTVQQLIQSLDSVAGQIDEFSSHINIPRVDELVSELETLANDAQASAEAEDDETCSDCGEPLDECVCDDEDSDDE